MEPHDNEDNISSNSNRTLNKYKFFGWVLRWANTNPNRLKRKVILATVKHKIVG